MLLYNRTIAVIDFIVLYSYGFVEFSSVEEAKAVEERQEGITMDGNTLHITYASPKGKDKNIHSHNGPLSQHALFCPCKKRSVLCNGVCV